MIYVIFSRENSLCTAYCGWLAGLLASWGVAEGIYTDIMSSENRKLVFTPRPGPELGETLPSPAGERCDTNGMY